MTTSATLRSAAGILMAEADRQDGKVSGPQQMTTYDGRSVTVAEAWAFMLEEIANRRKPHDGVDAGAGGIFGQGTIGDNDDSAEYDDLLRAFGPFCDHAKMAEQKDSTGALFYVPHIKRRGGIGLQSVRLIRDEIRGVWFSDWGKAWRADQLNANLVPKQEVVDALFAKVYG